MKLLKGVIQNIRQDIFSVSNTNCMHESITKNNEEINNTCLKITFNQDITEDMGELIPYPQKHFIANQIFVYYWYIDGFFGTNKAIEFINDIKARFLISYPNKINEIRHFNTKENAYLHLKQFQGLKSRTIAIINKTNRFDGSTDFIFWCLKLHAEDLIKEMGCVYYEDLLSFGAANFGGTQTKSCKDYSTLKSKCRSIVNYYIDKNYKLDRYEKKYKSQNELKELKMNRQENANRMSKLKKETTRQKIVALIYSLWSNDFKFHTGKNIGKWNVSKLSKELEISRPTLIKHLTEMGEL